MPTAKQTKININLLYPQGLSQKLFIKLVRWTLTFGRYITIVVEIVVLAAFAMRFKLDSDLANIKSQINEKVPIIESMSEDEVSIRQLQFKLNLISKGLTTNPVWQDLAKRIANQTPLGVKLQNLSLSTDAKNAASFQFKVTGTTSSNDDLAAFLFGLNQDGKFQNVGLTNINLDDSTKNKIITFTITGVTK